MAGETISAEQNVRGELSVLEIKIVETLKGEFFLYVDELPYASAKDKREVQSIITTLLDESIPQPQEQLQSQTPSQEKKGN